MGKIVVIFDFDGVLADSFKNLYEMNALAFETQGKNLTERQYRDFFIGSFNDSVKDFCGDQPSYENLKNFKEKFKENIYESVELFPGSKPLILKLKEQNVNLGIISTTSEKMIIKFLGKFGLTDCFNFILSSSGESKIETLKHAVLSNGYEINKSYFVSDTFNDIIDGKEAGLKTIAVLWGFHGKELLLKSGPDFILKNYKEIFSIIN